MLNQPNPDIPPKMTACLIDVSEHCSEDFLAKCGGKIYMSGFYDDNVNTYCCSTTPSVFVDVIELVPETYPEDEDAREALSEELLEAHTADDSGYYNRRDIERMRADHPERFKDLGMTFDEDENPEEMVREHLCGNPVF